jgi:hypothetical protein
VPIVHAEPKSPGAPITEAWFGFIAEPTSWSIGDHAVEPVEDFDECVSWVRDNGHERENVFHPPATELVDGEGHTLPRSRGVEEMYRLPATHRIRRRDGAALGFSEDFRTREGAVLVHALAFLYGARCQFEEWWFEGPVPLKVSPVCFMRPTHASAAVAEIVDVYRKQHSVLDKRLPRLLFMKNRSAYYPWVWEQFLVEYTVFEGLWKIGELLGTTQLAKDKNGDPEYISHKRRFEHLGGKALIHWETEEADLAGAFVGARNDLVHEAMFDKASEDIYMPLDLARLNNRLVFTALGVRCEFARSAWNRLHSYPELGLGR